MVINEKDVGKNVSVHAFTGARVRPPGAPAGSSGPDTVPHCARLPFGSPRTGRRSAGTAWLAGLVFALAFASVPASSQARSSDSTAAPVALSSLPREAQQTEQRIFAGGPFPYSQDGVVFANRERHLTSHPRGYYHEYTVPSPGAHNRGARRIVCGGAKPTEPDDCFYTEDHYNSFHRILK